MTDQSFVVRGATAGPSAADASAAGGLAGPAERSADLPSARELLGGFGHELRAPLNAIMGFADLLERRSFGDLNEKQVKYVGYILSSSRKLLDLVSTLMDMATFDGVLRAPMPERVAVSGVVDAALGMVRERAQKHGIRLTTTDQAEGAEVTADRLLLSGALYHLIASAVGRPDAVEVTVSCTHVDGETRIAVTATVPQREAEPTHPPRVTLPQWRQSFIEAVLRLHRGELRFRDPGVEAGIVAEARFLGIEHISGGGS